MQLELFSNEEPETIYAPNVRGPKCVRKFSSLKAGVPRLVIEGKWLTKLGVRVGDIVHIQYYPDRIVILWEAAESGALPLDK